jgi:hypothetical protein
MGDFYMSLGIPYMGSKRKLAPDIIRFIQSRHWGITDFYDLFGGGGSVSFTAVANCHFNVHYNELNPHIYHLVNYLKSNRTLEPKFYDWVTREEFFRQCAREDADWYSGYVMSCWSFGNKQSSYIYGEDIEEMKRLAHEFVVNGCLDSMVKLEVDIPELMNIKNIQKRRIVFCDYIQKGMGRFDLQNQERLQQLERIQNLQNLQNLQITNLSYEMVNITGNNPVIYCDIPYKGTGEYKEGGFDHEAFYTWAADSPYAVYISEYAAPFQEVHAFKHRSSLSATNNKKKTIEKIFWNGKGEPFQHQLF